MIVYPNAKINIGLRIVAKRPDGFHDIETCFYPVPVCDILEFVETNSMTAFSSSGLPIPGNNEANICVLAWQLLNSEFDIPPVKIHLHKIIPIGAGLGGGSADGAFMLKGLNDYFKIGIKEDRLIEIAGKLGSDCAFFISNQTAIGTKKGNVLEPFKLSMEGYKIVLINPGIHVGTAEAYAGIIPVKPGTSLKELLKKPIANWKSEVVNDFEEGVFQQYPEIEEIKNQLYKLGATYAVMSGSGSTVFGLFHERVPVAVDKFFKKHFLFKV